MENNSDKVQKDENKAKKNGNNTKRAGACGCAQVFEMAKSQVGQNASNFWTLSYCLKQFFEEQKALPVCRLTADFAADTKSYLELQKIYNEKAERDERRLRELLGQLDVHPSAKLNVSQEEIKCFCKNAANLKVTQYPKITGAFLGSTSVELLAAAAREMQQAVPEELKLSPNADPDLFADPNFSVYEENGFLHLPWYAAALACRAAAAKLGRFPGSHPKPSAAAATAATGEAAAAATGGAAAARSVEEAIKQQQELVEKDSAAVLLELEEMEKAVGCRLFAAAKVVQQLVSYRGSEFPATAALVGAVAAQEAIKLLNKKFEPINNTFLWNGVQRRGLTMQL